MYSDSSVAKQFTDKLDFVRELYYSRVVHEQPWASVGFLKPVGYQYDSNTIFYPITEQFTSVGGWELYNLARALYWLSKIGLYPRITTDTLRVFEGRLVLTDYEFSNEPIDVINELVSVVGQQSIDDFINQLVPRPIYRLPLPRTIDEFINDIALRPVLHRPSIVGTFDEFYRGLQSIRSDVPVQIGSGGFGCVYRPPIGCDNLPDRDRLVGKVLKYGDPFVERELNGAELMDQIDPTGEFHTRMVHRCQIKPPTDCQYEDEKPAGKITEFIYEYGGVPIEDVIERVENNLVDRFWFYVGLEKFLEHLTRMAEMEVIHLDLRPINVMVDSQYNLRIIDFGNVIRFTDPDALVRIAEDIHILPAIWLEPIPWNDPINSEIRYWRQRNEEPIYNVIKDLHGMDENEFIPQLKRFIGRMIRLLPDQQLSWMMSRIDSLTFGTTFALMLHRKSSAIYTELKPVLYHLIAFDYHDRDIILARSYLQKLIDTLEEQVGTLLESDTQ